ncbi:MAG: hypothetical protein HGA47_15500, partial [Zoogloea sp.]|nr:hypothetical protein [Zoogloea sp.]
SAVREVFLLPWLTPLDGAPPWLAGSLDHRGTVVAVADLARRLGRPAPARTTGDVVILVEHQGALLGLAVSSVDDVLHVPDECISSLPTTLADGGHGLAASGLARHGGALVSVLDVATLFAACFATGPAPHAAPEADAAPADTGGARQMALFTPDEKALLMKRAQRLAETGHREAATHAMPLAIVTLAGERFALALDQVREFGEARLIVPVPCCPPHIAGNMNLRGDILPLVDLRQILHLPAGPAPHRVVVVHIEALGRLGLLVDQPEEVAELGVDDSGTLPASLENAAADTFLRGLAQWGGGRVPILDIDKLFARPGMVVNETV